jgi:hypothetical protein
MKRTLITATCCIGLLLATANTNAQSASRANAKVVPPENALKPSAKPTTNDIKAQDIPTPLPAPKVATDQEKATPVTAPSSGKESSNTLPKGVKMQVVSADNRSATQPNSEENRQTMSGTAKVPKEQLNAPVFTDQNVKPAVVPKPAAVATPSTAKPATNPDMKVQKPGNRR